MVEQRRTIEIIVIDSGQFDVRERDLTAPGLVWDELLGQIASMTHPKLKDHAHFAMYTSEEIKGTWADRTLDAETETRPLRHSHAKDLTK
jgi:hypothetical protein